MYTDKEYLNTMFNAIQEKLDSISKQLDSEHEEVKKKLQNHEERLSTLEAIKHDVKGNLKYFIIGAICVIGLSSIMTASEGSLLQLGGWLLSHFF